MKKILAVTLAMLMLLSFTACGGDAPAEDNGDASTTTTTASTTTTTVAENTDPTEEATTTGDATQPTEGTTEGDADDITTAVVGDPTEGTTAPTEGTTTQKPTSTTTTKKTTTTTTTVVVDNRPTIKILSIGHSFSRDAMDTYMADLFKAAGYNATFGYLYYPSASLEQQYHYIKDDSTSYEHYNKCVDGRWRENGSAKASDALYDEAWDIVTFQPDPDYGKGMAYECKWGCNKTIETDYVHFDQLVKMVKDKLKSVGNTDVKFYWHLTWAFASDCREWSFAHSNYNQQTMYWDFIKATAKYVTPNKTILGTIPCNTSIQNVRTSWMGDTFNEPSFGADGKPLDGYHLNDKGDLVAAMTWVAYFTGQSAADFKIKTKYSDREYAAFAEAVDNAIKTPLNITKSTYTTES